MDWLIAAALLGALATFLVPAVAKYVTQVIPSNLASNVFVQVLVVGFILAGGLYALKKIGFGKFLSKVE